MSPYASVPINGESIGSHFVSPVCVCAGVCVFMGTWVCRCADASPSVCICRTEVSFLRSYPPCRCEEASLTVAQSLLVMLDRHTSETQGCSLLCLPSTEMVTAIPVLRAGRFQLRPLYLQTYCSPSNLSNPWFYSLSYLLENNTALISTKRRHGTELNIRTYELSWKMISSSSAANDFSS